MTTPAQAMVGELLPCPNPWCRDSRPALMQGGFRNLYSRVECDNCGMRGPQRDDITGGGLAAITAWNTRPESLSARAAGVDLASIWELARSINDSDALMKVYAAPEWDDLSNDGKTWVAALVAETLRRERSDELAYFGASEFAPYAFRGEDQQALRDAFCQGAAIPSKPGGADLLNEIFEFLGGVDDASELRAKILASMKGEG